MRQPGFFAWREASILRAHALRVGFEARFTVLRGVVFLLIKRFVVRFAFALVTLAGFGFFTTSSLSL